MEYTELYFKIKVYSEAVVLVIVIVVVLYNIFKKDP